MSLFPLFQEFYRRLPKNLEAKTRPGHLSHRGLANKYHVSHYVPSHQVNCGQVSSSEFLRSSIERSPFPFWPRRDCGIVNQCRRVGDTTLPPSTWNVNKTPCPLLSCFPPPHVTVHSQLYPPGFRRWRGQPIRRRCRWCWRHPRDNRPLLCAQLQG